VDLSVPASNQTTRISSANPSARRAVGRTSVPRSWKPRRPGLHRALRRVASPDELPKSSVGHGATEIGPSAPGSGQHLLSREARHHGLDRRVAGKGVSVGTRATAGSRAGWTTPWPPRDQCGATGDLIRPSSDPEEALNCGFSCAPGPNRTKRGDIHPGRLCR
jgi:hypothetical protein